MKNLQFYQIANNLETAGLVWLPEIGDEISRRSEPENISILVDPTSMRPAELRSCYLWLPTLEQLVEQVEVRQGILFHAGLELSEKYLGYKAVIQTQAGLIEAQADSLRKALGLSLLDLMLGEGSSSVH